MARTVSLVEREEIAQPQPLKRATATKKKKKEVEKESPKKSPSKHRIMKQREYEAKRAAKRIRVSKACDSADSTWPSVWSRFGMVCSIFWMHDVCLIMTNLMCANWCVRA